MNRTARSFSSIRNIRRMSIAKETELFFANIDSRRPANHRLSSNAKYTFLNDRLADFYGIPGGEGSAEFRKVDLSGSNRQGVLTQASVLTVSSYANRTSPVIRGKWVLENYSERRRRHLRRQTSQALDESRRWRQPAFDAGAIGNSTGRTRSAPPATPAWIRSGSRLENFDAIGQWRIQGRQISYRRNRANFPTGASSKEPGAWRTCLCLTPMHSRKASDGKNADLRARAR